jgi:hypothetical protein
MDDIHKNENEKQKRTGCKVTFILPALKDKRVFGSASRLRETPGMDPPSMANSSAFILLLFDK